MAGYTVSQFITPFLNRPTANPDHTIGQVLEATDSSHKPVYVFDGKKYLGVVSAYQSIYHNFHAPYTKKVLSELMHTPHISPESTLYEALRAMMDTRLYELPVEEKNNKLQGLITLDSILRGITRDEMISAYLIQCIEPNSPITHGHDGTIEDIFHMLREKNISRIILTDKNGKVSGIISRSDIQSAFLRPTNRQRFHGPSEDSRTMVFDQEQTYRDDDPVERFSQKNVFTLPTTLPKRELIKQLIESEFNSVVLVDRLQKPVGFLSLRDIVHCLATFEPDTTIPVVFQKPDNSVPKAVVESAQQKIDKVVKKLNKIQPIEKIDIAVKEQKYSNQKVAEYETRIVISMKGTNVMASAESQEYLTSVKNALDQAEKQFIRNTKHTFHKVHSSTL